MSNPPDSSDPPVPSPSAPGAPPRPDVAPVAPVASHVTHPTETPATTEEVRRTGMRDPLRPRCHLTAPRGWLNDPNGLFQRGGQTHLFYQHNPHRAAWGPPHWGHAVSDDLVRWRDRPVALRPGDAPADDGGCWSGCMVDDGGTPTILYTGVKHDEQTTCLAFGGDDLDRWRKYESNPVQRTPDALPDGLAITQRSFRDPYVWRHGDAWLMAIGVSIADRGDALLYRSDDLRDWDLIGPLVTRTERDRWPDASHTWECPNLFPLGERWVLLVSLATPEALAWPVAFVGDFDGERFRPESKQRVDWGFHAFYAPLTIRGDDGRRLIWGWLQEQRLGAAQLEAGWSGAMSLPRELTLERGELRQRFVPEIAGLRGAGMERGALELAGTHALDGLDGHQLELRLTLERGSAPRCGVTLRHGPEHATRLTIDWDAGILSCDAPGSSADGELRWAGNALELGDAADRVELHLVHDRSALEVLANGRALTARLYPETLAEGGVELVAEGGTARAREVEGWKLEPIQTV